MNNAFVIIFLKTMYDLRQLLDLVFVISRVIKVSVSVTNNNTYLNLGYFDYHKNLIQ